MYNNCKIVNPINKHKFTFIMLHPMFCDYTYFDGLLYNFKKYSIYFNNIKFIFPNAPILDIDYPNNKQFNVNSWYNYYTCYDNIDKIDEINLENFNYQTKRIQKILNNEAILLNSYKNIYLGGVSQGGTLVFNILNNINRNIGAIFIVKSLYMHKYINLKQNKNTPIYIYSGNIDEVYTITFQKKMVENLFNYTIYWNIIQNLDHGSKILEEDLFIINSFSNNLTNIKL